VKSEGIQLSSEVVEKARKALEEHKD